MDPLPIHWCLCVTLCAVTAQSSSGLLSSSSCHLLNSICTFWTSAATFSLPCFSPFGSISSTESQPLRKSICMGNCVIALVCSPSTHQLLIIFCCSTNGQKVEGGKTALGAMVISEFGSFWRKTDQATSKRVKDTVLDDAWCERVDLTIKIMDLIIALLPFAGIDQPTLGEVYEGWDSMIEFMRTIILQNECPEYETSSEAFCTTIHDILVNIWDKNCTPLHCLAHSLNPK